MERNPPSASFERLNKKNTGAGIHIQHAEAQCFPEADASAIKHEY
jgi:hypothetical protein